jgi:hypothetical protein
MVADDNSIPIYDMNFSFVQSIKFDSHENLLNWIKNNKLDNKLSGTTALSSIIIFNNDTGIFGNSTANSILT